MYFASLEWLRNKSLYHVRLLSRLSGSNVVNSPDKTLDAFDFELDYIVDYIVECRISNGLFT